MRGDDVTSEVIVRAPVRAQPGVYVDEMVCGSGKFACSLGDCSLQSLSFIIYAGVANCSFDYSLQLGVALNHFAPFDS